MTVEQLQAELDRLDKRLLGADYETFLYADRN